MRNFLNFIPRCWRLPTVLLGGVFAGLLLFIVYISNFFSYMSDSPNTCMNCHIMGPEYATWYHSSHRENASCNDCHVPQDNLASKMFFKAMDGMRHSAIFTMRAEQQAIMIKEAGSKAVQKNCIRCHKNVLWPLYAMKSNSINSNDSYGRKCWECHKEVPHGKVRSLSSTPFAKVPTTKSVVPKWLTELLNKENRK